MSKIVEKHSLWSFFTVKISEHVHKFHMSLQGNQRDRISLAAVINACLVLLQINNKK